MMARALAVFAFLAAGCLSLERPQGLSVDASTTDIVTPAACGAEGQACCDGQDGGGACNGGLGCVGGVCTSACPAGSSRCDGACVPLTTAERCGRCDARCASGEVCGPTTDGGYACRATCVAPSPTRCGASCVDTDTDANHCGRCDARCHTDHAIALCDAGRCAVAACLAGYADCDRDAANGCEVPTSANPMSCGVCGNRCAFQNAEAGCADGVCRMGACAPGYADCDHSPVNGCETPVSGDVMNCGACGRACPAPVAGLTAVCRDGVCGTSAVHCDTTPGLGNCDGIDGNGCEQDILGSPLHCGACGRRCSANNGTPRCAAGACGITCAAGYADCANGVTDGCETNLQTSAASCGACGRACALFQATAACAMGVCQVGACNAGYGNCDASPANGCETNLRNDPNHCGACGHACPAGQSCVAGACQIVCPAGQTQCGARCVDVSADLNHCGACGRACPAPVGATPSCVGGTCRLSSVVCPRGTANCDGNDANGCEVTDADTNPARCGPACVACGAAHGTATCAAGSCGVTCASGFANCDGVAGNGCEVSLATVANCGRCGNACNVFRATAACAAGACAVASCNAGFLDCNASAADGCETDGRSNNTNCGACGRACAGGQVCVMGACACPAGQLVCAGACRDVSSDNTHCGACGAACVGGSACAGGACRCASGLTLCGAGASAACRDLASDAANCGMCGRACAAGQVCAMGACACPSGLTACGTTCQNLQTDPMNCGACGRACAAGQVCSAGVCGTICGGGLTNCSDVCRNVQTEPANCGGCGMACSTANVTPTCAAGACAGTCASGYADCNTNLRGDGCEVNTQTDAMHCGGCGMACSSNNVARACSGGTCNGACAAGFADCNGDRRADGCEVNTQTAVAHCGGCGMACSTANVTAACVMGACAGTCAAGYADCNSDQRADGCEVSTQTDAMHCGGCGMACSSNNVSRVCAAGQCAGSCAAGFGDCNGDKRSDGCETNLQASAAHCGACGQMCPRTGANTASASCNAGRCDCAPGYGDCNDARADGCEAALASDRANCGACGATCPSGGAGNTLDGSCALGKCACAVGYRDCDNDRSNGCETAGLACP